MRLIEISQKSGIALCVLADSLRKQWKDVKADPNFKITEEQCEYLKVEFKIYNDSDQDVDIFSKTVSNNKNTVEDKKLVFQTDNVVAKKKQNAKLEKKDDDVITQENNISTDDIDKANTTDINIKKITVYDTIDLSKVNSGPVWWHKKPTKNKNSDNENVDSRDVQREESIYEQNDNTRLSSLVGNKDIEEKEKREDIVGYDIDNSIVRDIGSNESFEQKYNNAKMRKKITLAKIKEYKKLKEEKILAKKVDEKEKEDRVIHVSGVVTVRDLAGLMEIDVSEILSKCMDLSLPISINQKLDNDIISLLSSEFGYEVLFENIFQHQAIAQEISPHTGQLQKRSPIVTIMGHVDHGKTTLIDYIRKSSVAKVEAGGITQHINAYKVTTKNGNEITFIDTPGHESFTAMRARGINLADIIIVIIALDSGVQKQTVEILSQLQLTNKPIIFALNKIDKGTDKIEKVKEDLAKLNFIVEDWGGKYQTQGISARSGEGVQELLEKVILESDILGLKANFSGKATGVSLDSMSEKGNGYLNSILVQNGELKIGDIVVSGAVYGKVKIMKNTFGENVRTAYPSDPVVIIGVNGHMKSGEKFYVVEKERDAKDLTRKYQQSYKEQQIMSQNKVSFEYFKNIDSNVEKINIIIKADVDGSTQVLSDLFFNLSTEECKINIVRSSIGEVCISDIELADITKAMIICFNVKVPVAMRKLAEKKGIKVNSYSVIYDIVDNMHEIITSFLEGDKQEVLTAKADVVKVFKISKVGNIAGCIVREGTVCVTDEVKVVRNENVIFVGTIKSLKHMKNPIKEAKCDTECGVCINKFNDIKENDVLEFYKKVNKK